MPNEIESWDRLYENSGNVKSPYSADLHKKILELIPSDVKTILDAGCGGGAFMALLSRQDKYEIEGVDMSSTGVRNIVKKGMMAHVGDLTNLHQFPDNTFDLVICIEVTEHLKPEVLEKSLAEMFRVSRKYVITSNPYKEILTYHQLICKGCQSRYHPAGHIHSVDEAWLHNKIEKYSDSMSIHYSGMKEWHSTIFAEMLRFNGYQVLSDLGTHCPVCGFPERPKNWTFSIRIFGYAYRATQIMLRMLGFVKASNIIVVATVKK